MNYIIEIATADYTTSKLAVLGGADRIELCNNLAEGGTTPSFAVIKKCRELQVLLYPIVRPRGGDFLYTNEEFEIMLQEVIFCRTNGCDGVVIGILNKDGSIDKQRTSRLVDAAYPMGVTFHRAFDRCRDPFEGLEDIIQTGCERILTSGQKTTALEGADLIASLVEKAEGRIIIMPGSGVRPDNVGELARKTKCNEFHTSLRGRKKSEMEFQHPSFANSEESYSNPWINPEEVREMRKRLLNF